MAYLPCTTGAIAGIVNHARHVRRNNKVREHVFPGMFGYKDGIAVFPSAALLEVDSFQRSDLTRVGKLFSFGADCERIRDAAAPASRVRQTGEYF